jgi:stage V sporulation protein G
MFSYDIKIRKFNSTSNLKAFVSLTIDEVMEIDGFKVIDGKNGLFVSAPSHKGTVMEDGIKVEKYFDDIRFPGEVGQEFSNELKAAILNAYNNASDPLSPKQNQAKAIKAKAEGKSTSPPTSSTEQASGPERTRKPLWGF